MRTRYTNEVICIKLSPAEPEEEEKNEREAAAAVLLVATAYLHGVTARAIKTKRSSP